MTDDIRPAPAGAPRALGRRIALAVLPLVLFVAVAAYLYNGLYLNPREIPSNLIGKPVPQFDLPPIGGQKGGLSTADLAGEVSLVNVFASWCVACRAEHPILMRMNEEGVLPIHGLNYKDDPDAALGWLARFGVPYARAGSDRSGRVGIDFGVYGVPESFVIDGRGNIVCKQIGPINEHDLKTKLLPAIEAARRGETTSC